MITDIFGIKVWYSVFFKQLMSMVFYYINSQECLSCTDIKS